MNVKHTDACAIVSRCWKQVKANTSIGKNVSRFENDSVLYLVGGSNDFELDGITVTVEGVQSDTDKTAEVQNETETGKVQPHGAEMTRAT